MTDLQKHYGQIISTGSRCIVVFRELPNDDGTVDKETCLIVNSDTMPSIYSDAVANFVRGKAAQSASNLYESMNAMGSMPTGENMLNALHNRGLLRPWKTSDIQMKVTPTYNIPLPELNDQIRLIESGKSEDEIPSSFNPFEQLNGHIEEEQKAGIAWNLVQESQDMQRVATEKLERAYDLNPALKPPTDENVTVTDESKPSLTTFTVDTADMTQSKAIQALKEHMKALKGANAKK